MRLRKLLVVWSQGRRWGLKKGRAGARGAALEERKEGLWAPTPPPTHMHTPSSCLFPSAAEDPFLGELELGIGTWWESIVWGGTALVPQLGRRVCFCKESS